MPGADPYPLIAMGKDFDRSLTGSGPFGKKREEEEFCVEALEEDSATFAGSDF